MSSPLRLASIVLLGSILSACGGGGGGASTGSSASIAGSAIDGPMNASTVTAYAINNGARGAMLGSTATDASGHFTVSLGGYAGSVMLQVSGGSYIDEATGSSMSMSGSTVMTAMIAAVGSGQALTGIQITPLTSMAQAYAKGMAGGMTDANIGSANAALGTYFGVALNGAGDILHTAPIDPTAGGSGSGASQSAIDYGMVLAALSQYAHAQGMPSSSSMITAFMSDASDGVLNGTTSSGQVMMGGMGMGGSAAMPATAGTTGLSAAMSTFLSSAQNQSGVTAAQMQTLITTLAASSGAL